MKENASTQSDFQYGWDAEWFICTRCRAGNMRYTGAHELFCQGCNASFPVEAGVPVFFAEFLKSEELAEREFWEKSYDAQDDGSFKTFTDDSYREVINLFEIPSSGLGLEYACGSGAFSSFVSGPKMVGLDISLTLLKNAPSLTGVQGSGEVLPFRDRLFDFVLCAAVLHHIPDLAKGVAEISRVVKPGGWIYILEPNLNHTQRKLVAAATSPWRKTFSSTHFSPAENLIPGRVLTDLLERNGFSIHTRTYLSPRNRQSTPVGNVQQVVSSLLAHGPLAQLLESYVLIRAKRC